MQQPFYQQCYSLHSWGGGRRTSGPYTADSILGHVDWGGMICCLDEGIIFNVDGPSGSVVRVNDKKYSCDIHPEKVSGSAGNCDKKVDPLGYFCSSWHEFSESPGICPDSTCSDALKPLRECKSCSTPDKYHLVATSCPKCGALIDECREPYKKLGTSITATSETIGLPSTECFEKNGAIKIYDIKKIPEAKSV